MKSNRNGFIGKSAKLVLKPAFFLILFFLLLQLVAPPFSVAAPPKYEIKVATLAPENSTLMQVFKEMNEELLKKTEGQVGFKFFPGFVLGDEQDVLRKLRVGMVNAAVFTTTALTEVNPDFGVLQVPFLFNNYDEVDHILGKLDETFKKGSAKRGYEVLGWTEVGFIYFMSTIPVTSFSDLKGKKVWNVPSSPMTGAMIQKAGVSSVTVSIPDVLVSLQTNLLDVVYNSPYYAVVTQWYTRLKYVTDLPLSYIGAVLLMNQKKFKEVPPQYQEVLQKVCSEYMQKLTERTRKDNADAMNVMLKRGIERVTPKPEDVKGFKELSDSVINDLDPKILPRDILEKVRAELADYRANAPKKQ